MISAHHCKIHTRLLAGGFLGLSLLLGLDLCLGDNLFGIVLPVTSLLRCPWYQELLRSA